MSTSHGLLFSLHENPRQKEPRPHFPAPQRHNQARGNKLKSSGVWWGFRKFDSTGQRHLTKLTSSIFGPSHLDTGHLIKPIWAGRALPTLAYKLDHHTRSDYLDCHIYLERGAIHHSSAADSTRPTLIPSGGESSLSQHRIRWCLSTHPTLVQHLDSHYPGRKCRLCLQRAHRSVKAGEGSTLVKKQSASGIPACVPAYRPFGTGTLTRVIITNKVGYSPI